MSNGFSAADMSTAAANGHAEGYQAGYADAVKAVEAGKDAAMQATSAEVGGMIRPFQIGDRVRVVYAIASSGHYRAGDVGSVERVSPFSGAARVHFDHFTFNQSVYCYHRELELIEAAGKQPTSHGAGDQA